MKREAFSSKGDPSWTLVDMLRGLLSIVVLLGHALESGLLLVEGSVAPAWVEVLFGHGGFMVNGFFVLSGFCIHRSILSQRKRGGPFALSYALARITRLYPLYLLALLAGLGVAGWPGPGALVSHLLMLQGLTGVMPAVKPAWSLTYEAVYYLVWPLLLVGCGWRSTRAFVSGMVGALVVAGGLFAVWKIWQGGAKDSPIMVLALVAAQFPLWLGGAWLAQMWDVLLPRVRPWLAPAALCWILGCYAAHVWLVHRGSPTSVLVALAWVCVPGWLGLVLGSACWPVVLKAQSVAGWLGLLSYPLYILHQPLLDGAVMVARSHGMALGLMEATVLLTACVMVCMLAVGLPLEAFLLRWRARVLRRREAAAFKPVSASLPDA